MRAMGNMGAAYKNPLVWAGVVVVVFCLGVAVYYMVLSRRKSPAETEEEQALDAELSGGGSASMSGMQYATYAKRLYEAMKGLGTDEEAIYSVFRSLATRADVLQVIVKFRALYDEDLTEWLYGDLNNKEIAKVNTILKEKGIDYAF